MNLNTLLKDNGISKSWLGRKLGVHRETIYNWCKQEHLTLMQEAAILHVLRIDYNQRQNNGVSNHEIRKEAINNEG